MLVLEVIGPSLQTMLDCGRPVIEPAIESLARQIALGTSFLHYRGVVHGGQSTVLSTEVNRSTTHGRNLDLHSGNIAFEIPTLDGKLERDAIITLGEPRCVPVLARDQLHQTDSLPKYLVSSGSPEDCVKQGDLRVKLIDLGGGSLQRSQSCHSSISPRSLLRY